MSNRTRQNNKGANTKMESQTGGRHQKNPASLWAYTHQYTQLYITQVTTYNYIHISVHTTLDNMSANTKHISTDNFIHSTYTLAKR